MTTTKILGKVLSLFSFAFCSHHVGKKETAFSADELPLLQFSLPSLFLTASQWAKNGLEGGKIMIYVSDRYIFKDCQFHPATEPPPTDSNAVTKLIALSILWITGLK